MGKENNNLKCLTISAVFAALIAVFTAYLFHIPIPIGVSTAYLHFGDCFIFLLASLLPTGYAATSAAIGGGLADVLCGSAVWAPFTLVVKALMALCFSSKTEKVICKRNLLAVIPCLFITVIIYYIAEALIYGNWLSPAASIWGNIVQIAGSTVLYIFVGMATDKFKIKTIINRR